MRRYILWAPVILLSLAAGIFYADVPTSSDTQETIPVRELTERKAPAGVIEGRVVNAEGQIIVGADVFAELDAPVSAVNLSARSGDDGNFRIEVWEPGTYTLSGSKTGDGYALSLSAFHQDSSISIPKVEVRQGEVVKDVEVNLGWKASPLEGVIVNAADNEPIGAATITLRRADDPKILYIVGVGSVKKDGRIKLLVPHIPFTMEVSSPGYETWMSGTGDADNNADTLVVSPGEVKELRVALRPVKRYSTSKSSISPITNSHR